MKQLAVGNLLSEIDCQHVRIGSGARHVRNRVAHETIFPGRCLDGRDSLVAGTNKRFKSFGAIQIYRRISPNRLPGSRGVARRAYRNGAATHDSDRDTELRGHGAPLYLSAQGQENNREQTKEAAGRFYKRRSETTQVWLPPFRKARSASRWAKRRQLRLSVSPLAP